MITAAKETVSPWDDIASFLPADWRKIAADMNVMKGARQDKDVDSTLHTLLIHLACGYSLKETTTRARLTTPPLYSSSHVALRDRLIKFSGLFEALCRKMFIGHEPPDALSSSTERLRLIDATNVTENGPTGSTWRFHYSFSLPELACDFTKLTETHGKGTGENLIQFPMSAGDHIIADRGYSRASGIEYAHKSGAFVCIRLNTKSLKLVDCHGKPFKLVSHLRSLKAAGETSEWECCVNGPQTGTLIPGRLCVVRKSAEQIEECRKMMKRAASRDRVKIGKDTFFVNEYIIIFTTYEADKFPLQVILAIYRWRWQIELVFKRFKSLLALGHLPTREDISTKAWLYGKLLVALLVERISRHGNGSFSPWRENPVPEDDDKSLETVQFCNAFTSESTGASAVSDRNN